MKYSLAIFDLDGTILDTLDDLTDAVNFALERHGFPPHNRDRIRQTIGNGVANLIRRSVPEETSDAETAAVLDDFRAHYAAHVNVKTKPYPGVVEMLKTLRDAGILIGVNSNKFDAATQALCASHFSGLYDFAFGESERTPKKPDPTAALRMMEAARVSPKQTIYIGDSGVDLTTAKNAGCDCAWVSWGFRHADEMRDFALPRAFDEVEALEAFLLG